jgi:hypothetical protein
MLAFRKWTLSLEGYSSLTNALRLASAIIFLTLSVAAIAADAATMPAPQLPPPHQVDIPLSDGTLRAQLFKPDGDGPFPVVIALHGCAGLAGHSEPVLGRYRDWAEQLLKGGNAVLLPDSYGSRDLGPQCRVKERERRVLAAALGRPRPHQPSRMVERRQRAVVGGASAIVLAQCRAGLPLRGCVLSGLPGFGRPWLERAHSDAASDWRQG